jgi:hypothetical protein
MSTAVQARTLGIDEMSSTEMARAQRLAETVVKQDLAENTLARVYEAAGNTDEPPLSAETRQVLAKGAYMIIASNLAARGIYISEHAFTKKVGTILERMASLGLFPHAFTVGYMARYQVGLGMSLGSQFNFYIENGELKLSSYSLYGMQAGAAAQAKIQFYAALCFGACFGGDPNGWYVGTDVSASIGAGIDGFLEFGIDFTDMLKATVSGEGYSMKDMWESKAVYAGVGFDVGVGGGWSLDVFHYRMDFEKVLARPGNSPKNINPRTMTQYQLRTPPKN